MMHRIYCVSYMYVNIIITISIIFINYNALMIVIMCFIHTAYFAIYTHNVMHNVQNTIIIIMKIYKRMHFI